jgi:Uma2 family endonuclease
MSTEHLSTAASVPPELAVPAARRWSQIELQNGDRMNREEFHRLYEQTPEDFKAELIGGIVYVASPLFPGHGKPHLHLGTLVAIYEARTLGVDASDNTTILLGDEAEPQPDLYVRILPEFGGQTTTGENECVQGAPELIIEVANSSRAIDLHRKKQDYARYGVREYLVHCVSEKQLRWFDLVAGKELMPDADDVYRVRNFPGLWVNGRALAERSLPTLIQTLEQGLATPEHAAFVEKLAEHRAKP